jgi:hypothetical protein
MAINQFHAPQNAGWKVLKFSWRAALAVLISLLIVAALAASVMVVGNIGFSSQRDKPYRALGPDSPSCADASRDWDIFAKTKNGQIANDEWSAIQVNGQSWRTKLACTIQHHVLPGYVAEDRSTRQLKYDFDFLEFREDGKPYALREECRSGESNCADEGYGPVKLNPKKSIRFGICGLSTVRWRYMMAISSRHSFAQ